MALSVQTNTAALTALKNLNTNSQAMNNSLNRLSSGFRINSAADDASGFAISSKLDAQTGRLKAASQNATQATAMVKMADAGVNEIQNMVNRIQTLATQAASANNAGELGKLDAERVKLESAINKIANATNYNGVSLLNGTSGAGAATGVSTTNATIGGISLSGGSSTNLNATYKFTTDATTGNLSKITTAADTATNLLSSTVNFSANASTAVTLSDGTSLNVTFGGTNALTTTAQLVVSGQEQIVKGGAGTTAALSTASANTVGAVNNDKANGALVTASVVSTKAGLAAKSYDLVFAAKAASGTANTINIVNGTTTVGTLAIPIAGLAGGQNVLLNDGNTLNIKFGGAIAAAAGDGVTATTATKFLGVVKTADKSATTGSNTFQVGADNNANNQVTVNLSNSYTTSSLGLGGTGNLNSQTAAQSYIDVAKGALNKLVTQRADLGATQNQLGFVQANLATSIEQTTSAVSSIKDADMAMEMANFTKNKILTQAGTSMLAQANQASQNVLTLFR